MKGEYTFYSVGFKNNNLVNLYNQLSAVENADTDLKSGVHTHIFVKIGETKHEGSLLDPWSYNERKYICICCGEKKTKTNYFRFNVKTENNTTNIFPLETDVPEKFLPIKINEKNVGLMYELYNSALKLSQNKDNVDEVIANIKYLYNKKA